MGFLMSVLVLFLFISVVCVSERGWERGVCVFSVIYALVEEKKTTTKRCRNCHKSSAVHVVIDFAICV
jgi:hypothetical protein